MNLNKGISTPIALTILIILVVLILTAYNFMQQETLELTNQEELLDQDKISKEEAVILVENLPEVKEWLVLFSDDSEGNPMIKVDHETDEIYTVHVYEWIRDHTATFNWYDVNSETQEITPMFK